MQIGEMKHSVTWQQQTKVSDGMGGSDTTWVDVCTTWARILPTSAKEIRQSEQTVLVASHTIRIRYRSVFKSSWRGQFKGRYFAIVGIVNPEERGEWLDILVKEVSA